VLLREGDKRLLLISTVWVMLKLAPFRIESTHHSISFVVVVKVFAVAIGALSVIVLVWWSAKIAVLPVILEEWFLLERRLIVSLYI
jgi:hypothetical protein